jgi:hypothetical protein
MKCLVKGRYDPSRRERFDLRSQALSNLRDDSPSSETNHTVPYGTGFWMAYSRHSMPGYHHLVPSGQIHLPPYFDADRRLTDEG